ncbi:MAG: PKD domain-containing protein [Candidatus Dormibacteraeota bacterium]|nr:PKD domain-containing protein [Candidatus Dormibacteraeota bacterium]MBV9525650.1 PKD domain-containing protein [Candidatus Dormibacteraeota bacterium]
MAAATGAIALGSATVSGVSAASSSSSSSAARAHHPASIVPLRDATPFDQVFGNMDYNGGPVMPSNTDYMVLWNPPASGTSYPAGYVAGVSQWFTDLAHDSGGVQNTDSVSAQYGDLTGAFAKYATTFGGVLLDTDPYPTAQCPVNAPVVMCLTDAQIQTELVSYVTGHGLSADLSHEYFLLTPPHVETCFSNDPTMAFGGCSAGIVPFNGLAAFCAYHENTSLSQFLIYADDPYVPGNPHCDDGNHPNGFWDGELSGGLSHEQNESVTDPIPNDAWTNGAGANQGSEVGDQCNRQTGTPLGTVHGAKYNQVINGHFYWYQEEWSNIGHACLQRLTPPTTTPFATFKVTKGSGLTLNFDATGSIGSPGFVLYVWQFNDAFGAQTIEQSTPQISHTFPSVGAYSIGLTVFAVDGTSAGTGAIVTTGHSGFTPGFTTSPSHPKHGKTVTFHGLTTVSALPVLTYFWDFGDGTTGSGANPTHTYAAPGVYKVTQVMFSGVGSAFPGAGAGPVYQKNITVH